MGTEEKVLEIIRSSKVGNISCEEASIQICLFFNVGCRSENFSCGDLIKHNFSINKIGRCIPCSKEGVKVKDLPTNEDVYDKALHYIKSSGIIDNTTLRDAVFGAYKLGCYWMRKQIK